MEDRVLFRNEGLIDLTAINTFGVSAKENENPIGQFGTGLKYALAVLAREQIPVTIYIGLLEYRLKVLDKTIRNQVFKVVILEQYTLTGFHVGTEVMPFTTELGKNWELWMAFRELYSNTLDEKGMMEFVEENSTVYKSDSETQIIVASAEFVQIAKDKKDIFLETEASKDTTHFEVHDGRSGAVFNQGIKVVELEKPTLFRYNIKGKVELTEDRTLKSMYDFDSKLTHATAGSDDAELIEAIITAPEEVHESGLNFRWHSGSFSDTFMKTVKRLIKKSKDKINPTVVTAYNELVRKTRALKKDKSEQYVVTLVRPDGVPKTEMAKYIKDAVGGWKGSMMPEDPITDLEHDTIKVKPVEDGDIPF